MIRRKRSNFSPNFGEKPLQFPAKTFFFFFYFGLHPILAKKHFNFWRRPFFLVFIQCRRRNYVIFTKVLLHAKCVCSRLQKHPPMQNFTIKYWLVQYIVLVNCCSQFFKTVLIIFLKSIIFDNLFRILNFICF